MGRFRSLFDTLVANAAIPSYQLERRLDAFLAHYLSAVLDMYPCFNGKLSKAIIVPEFPLPNKSNHNALIQHRPSRGSWTVEHFADLNERKIITRRQDHIDYFVYVPDLETVALIEFKTDVKSVRHDQLERAALFSDLRSLRAWAEFVGKGKGRWKRPYQKFGPIVDSVPDVETEVQRFVLAPSGAADKLQEWKLEEWTLLPLDKLKTQSGDALLDDFMSCLASLGCSSGARQRGAKLVDFPHELARLPHGIQRDIKRIWRTEVASGRARFKQSRDWSGVTALKKVSQIVRRQGFGDDTRVWKALTGYGNELYYSKR